MLFFLFFICCFNVSIFQYQTLIFKLYLFYTSLIKSYSNLSKASLVGTNQGICVVLMWAETRVPLRKTTCLTGWPHIISPGNTRNQTKAARWDQSFNLSASFVWFRRHVQYGSFCFANRLWQRWQGYHKYLILFPQQTRNKIHK